MKLGVIFIHYLVFRVCKRATALIIFILVMFKKISRVSLVECQK